LEVAKHQEQDLSEIEKISDDQNREADLNQKDRDKDSVSLQMSGRQRLRQRKVDSTSPIPSSPIPQREDHLTRSRNR
jgi:hypothetical protein